MTLRRRALIATILLLPAVLSGQSLDLTIHNTGLSIGDSRFVRGVRINFRDSRLREVHGVNITVWTPDEPARGIVKGAAIGLPLTGARDIRGIGMGLLGLGVERD